MRRRLRQLLLFVLFLASAAVALLLGLNFFLNTGLLLLINKQPERLEMRWSYAWTWDAQRVWVEGFTLRVQGPLDQWWLTVDRAELTVELLPLLERRFQADDVWADGVAMHYRGRADAPDRNGEPVVYTEGRTAPIPGLNNPPDPRPEDIYPPPQAPWLVALDRVQIDGVRELWLGDYRFVGAAELSGELIVMPGSSLDVSGAALAITEGELLLDDIPVLSDLSVEIEGSLEGVDPVTDAGIALLAKLDALIRLGSQVDDLRYVDIFLRDAPWVGISGGSGRLDAVLDVHQGALGPLSEAHAVVSDLSARVGTYSALGDGRVDITIDQKARLALVFDRFAVHQTDGAPLVRGEGFRLDAVTETLRLDETPSGFTATATLPPSDVPSLARFDRYLPHGIGLRVLGGHATVSGHARIAEDGDHVSGGLHFYSPLARLSYDGIPVSGTVRLDGRIVSGRLDVGRYDIRGSSFAVDHVSVDGKPATWSARLDVREGRVSSSAATFLTTRSDFRCSDSSPFFRIAVGDRKIAPWVEKLVTLKNLKGEFRASFGQESLSVDHMLITTKKAEVHLHLLQKGDHTEALLFARAGILGVATRVVGDEYTVQLVNAKRWFHARLAEAGTPEAITNMRGEVLDENEQPTDSRKGIHLLGKDVRSFFTKKTPEQLAAAAAERQAATARRDAEALAASKARAERDAAEKAAKREVSVTKAEERAAVKAARDAERAAEREAKKRAAEEKRAKKNE